MLIAHQCDLWSCCLLIPLLVGCGHMIVLLEDMSYGRTCLMSICAPIIKVIYCFMFCSFFVVVFFNLNASLKGF